MRITLETEILVSDEQLEVLRREWRNNPKNFDNTVRRLLKQVGNFEQLGTSLANKLKKRFEDDSAAENPDLEAAKREIISTLYLYGDSDSHSRNSLHKTLQILDPGLARRVSEEGPDVIWRERYSEEDNLQSTDK